MLFSYNDPNIRIVPLDLNGTKGFGSQKLCFCNLTPKVIRYHY